jgi:7-dehydrocholesterol reductase
MSGPALEIYNAPDHLEAFKTFLLRELPTFSLYAVRIHLTWLFFQAALYAFLPAQIGYGQRTPAGHLLPYKVCAVVRKKKKGLHKGNTQAKQWD